MNKININAQVKIKLTISGKDVYKQYLSKYNYPADIKREVTDEVVMPLWEFAQIFGEHLFMGQTKAPFTENNEIEFI